MKKLITIIGCLLITIIPVFIIKAKVEIATLEDFFFLSMLCMCWLFTVVNAMCYFLKGDDLNGNRN